MKSTPEAPTPWAFWGRDFALVNDGSTMRIDTYSLPAYWASFLINGDASGLDDVELSIIEKWIDAAGVQGACLGCSDEPEFKRYHSAYPEVLAADCLEFHFPASAA